MLTDNWCVTPRIWWSRYITYYTINYVLIIKKNIIDFNYVSEN